MGGTISGLVAVLTPAMDAVDHVEFIGEPTTYKAGRVRPLTDVVPALNGWQGLGQQVFTIAPEGVTRTWLVVDLPLPDLLPYQFRAMLALSGHQTALDNYIAALPDPQKTVAQAKLDYSLAFQRNNDLVLAAQQGLGLTGDELDELWKQAAAI